MLRYRTEIHVPSDRFVCLQLPDRLPEGKAFIMVVFDPQGKANPPTAAENDSDRDDIEWWDEFEEDVFESL